MTTPNTPANGGQILTYHERIDADPGFIGVRSKEHMFDYVVAEVADLRASLAAPAIPTGDRNSVLTLKDLAAQFCESAESGAPLTISADSAALLFAAMTTPPAAPAKLEDAKFIAEAAKAGIFCTMPQAVAFGRTVESAVFGFAQPAAQVAVSEDTGILPQPHNLGLEHRSTARFPDMLTHGSTCFDDAAYHGYTLAPLWSNASDGEKSMWDVGFNCRGKYGAIVWPAATPATVKTAEGE